MLLSLLTGSWVSGYFSGITAPFPPLPILYIYTHYARAFY